MARTVSPPRWAVRTGLAAASTLALVGAALAATTPAQAASVNPYSPQAGHSYRHGAVPTLEANARMKSFHAVTPNASGTGQLTYGGGVDGIGVTTGQEKVYLVFYGSQWGTAGTDANGNTTFTGDSVGLAPRLQQLFKGVGTGGELWSGVMTQYCEGVAAGTVTCPGTAAHVGYPTGGALAGVWADTAAASPASATGHQLGVVGVAAASHFGNTTAALNRNAQYVVVSPHGTTPDGFNTASGNFCAWHDWNGDTTLTGGAVTSTVGDVAFTNFPYVTDAGASCGQGFVNAGAAGTLDGVTIVEGHEYAETITDQNPAGGWTDSTGFENGDKCAWISTGTGASANVAFTTGSFAMQSTYDNSVTNCSMTHPIVGGGGGNTVTVTNPGAQTGTVGTAASLTVTASDSGGAALTFSATGLPPGKTISTSGVISGTPTTAGTFSTTVTATDTTGASGSATFSWTINPVGGGCGGAGQKLANPGFESGAVSWAASAGVIGQNGPSEPAHGGTWNAWMDGYGTTHTDTLSQSVALPAGCTSYTLSFWLHIDSAETTTTSQFDKITIKAGATTLGTFSNLNKAAGYTLRSFSLAAFAGTTVSISFTATEDVSLQTSFVVDDTAVTVS